MLELSIGPKWGIPLTSSYRARLPIRVICSEKATSQYVCKLLFLLNLGQLRIYFCSCLCIQMIVIFLITNMLKPYVEKQL